MLFNIVYILSYYFYFLFVVVGCPTLWDGCSQNKFEYIKHPVVYFKITKTNLINKITQSFSHQSNDN